MATPQIVFITGCSSGIGFELLKLFDCEGYQVAGTALPSSYEGLMADPVTQSHRISVYPLDVADYAQASKLIAEVESTLGPIDILVNNAGISYRSVVEDMTEADEQRQMQVNYLGPMHLIRLVLPRMRQRRQGRIINISSVGGMMAMPTMASYSASKFALEGASESLWYELKPWNIKVTLVRPGFINSLAFTKVLYSRRKQDGTSAPEYDLHYKKMTQFVEGIMNCTPCSSRDVARKIFKIARENHPPLRAAGTPDAKVFYVVRRILPRFLYHILLYRSLPGVRKWGKSAKG